MATVTIASLFVMSAGLFKTGGVNFAGVLLAKLGRRSLWLALIVMMPAIGGLSAFINHTAVVAIFIPVVVGTPLNIMFWVLGSLLIPRFWLF
jgi:Na+/H+ antiporter NhaD/arsenite permease-like protein